MNLLKKHKLHPIKLIFLSFCIFFIFSNFEFKLSFIRASHIVEFINRDFYRNLNEIEIGNYKILYDTETSKKDIDYVIDILENKKDLPLKVLNIKEDNKTTIRILSKFNNSHSDSLGYVYFHNNVINILNRESHKKISLVESEEELNKIFTETLIHEYTHTLINNKLRENKIYPKKLPLWFNEGIAEYVGKVSIDEVVPTFALSEVKPSELNKMINTRTDLFYSQSSIFINFLITNYKNPIIDKILYNLKYNKFEEALEKTTSEDIDSLSLDAFNISY